MNKNNPDIISFPFYKKRLSHRYVFGFSFHKKPLIIVMVLCKVFFNQFIYLYGSIRFNNSDRNRNTHLF